MPTTAVCRKIAPPDRLMCETMPNTIVNRLACDCDPDEVCKFSNSTSQSGSICSTPHCPLTHHSDQHGGDQEKDAGDEGGEGLQDLGFIKTVKSKVAVQSMLN